MALIFNNTVLLNYNKLLFYIDTFVYSLEGFKLTFFFINLKT